MGSLSLSSLSDIAAWAPSVAARPPWTPEDRALVERMRARRASWDAIAGMLGRATPDVRRRFDPTYPEAARAEARAAAATSEGFRRGALRAAVLARLASPSTLADVAEAVGSTPSDVSQVVYRLRDAGLARTVGLSDRRRPRGGRRRLWTLTDAGRAKLERRDGR
jgi:DNA-binding MarR family transcriptional regulator